MLEGSLFLAGSLTRRLGIASRERAAFPFTVRPSPVGYASSADAEEASSRGEIWLPLWSSPATQAELRLIFSEGRADSGGRPARDGVDFARAVAALGVDRGIDSFLRYGFLKRSGKAYVAAPLGRFAVRVERGADLLHQLDAWLDTFRRACRAESVPARFPAVLRRTDAAILDLCRYGGAARMVEIIRALGQAERELANGEKFRSDEHRTIPPLGGLSPEWLDACEEDSGSAEFALARAVAFIRGGHGASALRTNLEPLERKRDRWIWAEAGASVVWSGADLCLNLTAVLERRLRDAGRYQTRGAAEGAAHGPMQLPLFSAFSVSPSHVASFLAGETDDEKLTELIWGLMLVEAPERSAASGRATEGARDPVDSLPRAYALLKLLFLPAGLAWPRGADPVALKPEPSILALLRGGRLGDACETARRRLWASGFVPLPAPSAGRRVRSGGDDFAFSNVPRLAAALIFPLRQGAVRRLADLVLRPTADSPV